MQLISKQDVKLKLSRMEALSNKKLDFTIHTGMKHGRCAQRKKRTTIAIFQTQICYRWSLMTLTSKIWKRICPSYQMRRRRGTLRNLGSHRTKPAFWLPKRRLLSTSKKLLRTERHRKQPQIGSSMNI